MRFMSFIAALLMTGAAHAADIAKVGETAPNFKTTNQLTGKTIELAAFKGQPVVLEWNNFGCPFVKAHYANGDMQALQKAAVADGVVWISINSSAEGKEGYLADAAAVNAAVTSHKAAPSAYVLDHSGEIGRAFGATTTPHMFVIDKDGTLAYAGAINDKASPKAADIAGAKNYVTAALAALKDGKPVEPSHTQPYGCGVKYGF
jgi:hypothetical protein